MLCGSSATQILQRFRHLTRLDLFLTYHCGHYDYHTAYCNDVLNETLTVLKNAFSYCGCERIKMSKRRAVDKSDLILVVKKRYVQMATGLKESFDTSNNDKCTPSMSLASPVSVTHHATSSMPAVENLEDSGIEVTPVVDKSLVHRPDMPGFLLNPPKSFPAPKFDFGSADVGSFRSSSETTLLDRSGSEKDISTEGDSVSGSTQHGLDKKDCTRGDDCAPSDRSPVVSHVCENISLPVCLEKPSSEGLNDGNETTTSVSLASRFFTEHCKAENPNQHHSREQGTKKQTHTPVLKSSALTMLLKDKPKEPVTTTTTTTTPPPPTTEHKKVESKSARGNQHSVLTSSKRETLVTNAQQKQVHQAKQGSSQSHTRKRKSAQRKLSDSSSVTDNESVRKVCEEDQKASVVSPQRKKKTVLPVSLLNDVVKTVQENVGNISRQVVASTSESSAPVAVVHAARKTKEAGSLAADTRCADSKTNNNQTDRYTDVALNYLFSDIASQQDALAMAASQNHVDEGKVKSENKSSSQPASPDKWSAVRSKKAKKKKKSRRQRKLTEGEGENLLGVLPDYVAEVDSRRNRKEKDKVYNLSALFSGHLLQQNQPRPKKSRPNYFFAIQITNPEIKTGFSAVLQGVEKACPKLKPAFVRVESAHLTLGVMHLPDEEAVTRVISLMEEFRVVHQHHRLQEGQELKEQGQEQQQSVEESVASLHLPTLPTCDSAVNPDAVCVKSDAADSVKVSASDSAKTLTLDDPSVIFTRDSVNTDSADPVNTNAANPVDIDTAAPVNIDTADPINIDAVDPENTKTADPEKTDAANPEKIDAADPEITDTTDLMNINAAHLAKANAADIDTAHPANVDTADPINTDTAHPANIGTADSVNTDTADPANTDTADPVNTDTADPANTDIADPASINTTDPVNTDAADLVITNAVAPVNIDNADPAKMDATDAADPANTDTVDPANINIADPVNIDTADSVTTNTAAMNIDTAKTDATDYSADPEKTDFVAPVNIDTAVLSKTDAADPANADAADSVTTNTAVQVNIDTADPTRTDAADPTNSDTVDPVKTDVADPTETSSAEAEKSNSADEEKKTTCSTSMLEVKGLDTFRNNVVFAKVTEGPALDQVKVMAELLRSQVLDLNITMDSRPFAAHITLMKMSKNSGQLRAAGIKKIDSKLYQEFSDTHFGSNTVTSIQLCSMEKPKKDNYYHIEHEIPVSVD